MTTRSIDTRVFGWAAAPILLAAVGCTSDPRYLKPPEAIVSMPDTVVVSRLDIPYELESTTDRRDREALAAQLGTEVPYVRLSDVRLSVEWTLRNDGPDAATANVLLNGANDRFYLDPTLVMPEPDEAPPPSLLGNTPVQVPGGSTLSGIFRDDELLEAAIDLELIARAQQSPFRALLTVNEGDREIQPYTLPDPDDPNSVAMPDGPPIPRQALAHFVRLDLGLRSATPLTLSYIVRVQDDRGVVHKDLLAAPAGELTMYTPTLYEPPIIEEP